MKHARRLLNDIRNANVKIKIIEAERREFVERATTLHAVDYTKDKIQSTPTDTMGEYIIKLTSYDDHLKTEIERLLTLKKLGVEILNEMENKSEANLLFLRYFQNKKIDDIATELNYSSRHINRLHTQALKHFQHVLECHSQSGL